MYSQNYPNTCASRETIERSTNTVSDNIHSSYIWSTVPMQPQPPNDILLECASGTNHFGVSQEKYLGSCLASSKPYSASKFDGNLAPLYGFVNRCYKFGCHDQSTPSHTSDKDIHSYILSSETRLPKHFNLRGRQALTKGLSCANSTGSRKTGSDLKRLKMSQNERGITLFSDLKRYPIVRRPINIMVTGSTIAYTSQDQNQKSVEIDLKIVQGSLGNILSYPWNSLEISEGRRIVRIERFQHVQTLQAQFLIFRTNINSKEKKPKSDYLDYLEVSCIRFDYKDGVTTNYFITSVEVIEIVEFLIGNKSLRSALKWKERGRIRSNLSALWFKDWSELGPIYLQFERQIKRYNSRNPYTMLKYMRLLPWGALDHALRKALLFYCIYVPVISKLGAQNSASEESKVEKLEVQNQF